jgi:20S proteasome alpha/beta subunit
VKNRREVLRTAGAVSDAQAWSKVLAPAAKETNLTFRQASDIRANAVVVQEGLERVIDRIVGLIVDGLVSTRQPEA